MSITGRRKAAMLLLSLDAATASELLRGQPQEVVQEIAMELSHLDASGQTSEDAVKIVAQEFSHALQTASGGLHVKSFVNNILKGAAGKEKAAELQAQMQKAIRDKDPFLAITSAAPAHIAAALEGEPPQAVALVLSELPSKLGTDVLSRLEDKAALEAVWRMTRPNEVSGRTIRRIGEMVCKRLMELTSEETRPVQETATTETLRKVALVLSGLEKERRDAIIEQIQTNDDEVARTVRALMVTWEDITKIEDRSLQEYLRKVESAVLAKALFGAEPATRDKILSNISQRVRELVEEETQLMGEPRKKDVAAAREEVVKPLREANETESLMFVEED